MSRFKVLALAAILALGSLTIATEASARGGHGGGGGHWGGGGGQWGGHAHFGGFHRGFGFRGFGWGVPYYGYYPYGGCWRWHRVWTPYGWRLHRFNACYYSRYYY